MPFAGVLSAERVERVCAKHGNLFGLNAVYSTAVMVWSFLGQVLRDGKEASCQAAVIVSLATGCAMSLALGPYSGTETGETALLRGQLSALPLGDLLIADRYDCSFFLIAMRLGRGVPVCARMHPQRPVDFRRGRRLGPHDHLIVWTKPARPDGMDAATYDALPTELVLRELRYSVVVPGRRTQTLTIATTLTDAEVYSKADIAELSGFRWHAELDIRAIQQSLNLNHVRCKSPAMVRKELWTTLLGDNLIRTTAAAAALWHDKQPRQLSFTGTCQSVLAAWMQLSCDRLAPMDLVRHCLKLLSQIAQCEVANRPDRIEPRVLKRRRHGYKLMQEPRSVLRARLVNPKPRQ